MPTISEEYKSLLDRALVAGPIGDDLIVAAENQLRVKFPPPYRSFLRQCGAAMGTGFEIAGLFSLSDRSPPMWRHVVTLSEQLRRITRDHLPPTFVPIADDGCGTIFYIDSTLQGNDTVSSIYAYGPGVECKIVSSNFEEFVVKLAKGELLV